jgi:CMP-N,N'-diacetyllegionaminic acid synthase
LSVVAIIPARGGSKGFPRKNLAPCCGKPLLAWSILQARGARRIDSVWVSSDDAEILDVSRQYGARPIRRPPELSGDEASSESAWSHALEQIEGAGEGPVEAVVGMQATSPVRESADLDGAVERFRGEGLDSLFSCCEIEDFFIWERAEGALRGVNHDHRHRRRRQAIERRYLENGSFYVFTPALLRATGNRLGGTIGVFPQPRHKMFQIDDEEGLRLCEAVMRGYGLDR